MRCPCATCVLLGLVVICVLQYAHATFDRQSREHRRRAERRARHGRKHVPTTSPSVHATSQASSQIEEYEYEQVYDEKEYVDVTDNHHDTSVEPSNPVTTPVPRLTEEQYIIRIRARELQKFKIQSHIMQIMGGNKQKSNVTDWRLRNQDAQAIEKYLMTSPKDEVSQTSHAHRYRFSSPSCSLPPKTHRSWRDTSVFRLYFDPKAPESSPLSEFKMSGALLRLYKKKHVECNCPTVPPTATNNRSKSKQPKPRRRSLGSSRSSRSERPVSSQRDRSRRRTGKRKKNSTRTPAPTGPTEGTAHHIRVTVYSYLKPVKKNKKIRKQMEMSRMVEQDYVGWLEIDIRLMVQAWLRRPRRNYGIEVMVEDDQQQLMDPFKIFDYIDCSKTSNQEGVYLNLTNIDESQLLNETLREGPFNLTAPNIQMTYINKPVVVDRRKREVSETCVLENAFVSFQEIGLGDWILAPQGLEAAYCRGHCRPLASKEHYNVGNNLDNETEVHKSCCGPTSFRPFRFLHYSDSGTLTVSSVDNFIVAECGCRK